MMKSGDSSKKRRLDLDDTEKSAVTSSCVEYRMEGQLPAELWALALQYLYFDEVQSCAGVNKFFYNDVSQQMKYLCIRSGKSMDVGPNVVERFSSVKEVYIYLIKDVTDDDQEDQFELDEDALKTAVPFISRLPKLNWCYIGQDKRYVMNSEIRWGYEYNRYGDAIDSYEQNSNEKFACLIHSVCRAYRTGIISEDVKFYGLINHQDFVFIQFCTWKYIPTISCYRNDVACQTCDAICSSFPLSQVLQFTDGDTPCIKCKNRINIVRFRDEERLEYHLTKALFSEVQSMRTAPVMCPPAFATTGYKAIYYDEEQYERMCLFILNGANAKDPEILNFLVEGGAMDYMFLGCKRIITLVAYTKLKNLGFDMSENDCMIIDESDRRTNYLSFMRAKDTRGKLKSGTKLCTMWEVQAEVRYFVQNSNREALTVMRVREMLQDWLGIDLSDRIDQVRLLVIYHE